MKLPVYLDNHATTRVDPRVIEVMVPLMSEGYGNSASRQHEFGWRAEAEVERARASVASLVGAQPEEIVFTSGATESINLALKGLAEARGSRGNHIVTAATEHKAVLDVCARLERMGFRVTTLSVDGEGLVDPEDVKKAITSATILVSIMTANNEIGTIAPVEEIGAICRAKGVPFHTDATQAAGKIPLDVDAMHIDMLSLSAHKMYGPKGVGALYVRSSANSLKIEPQIDGGGHERGLRSGTLNVPGIAGFGKAASLAATEMRFESRQLGMLRDRLVEGLSAAVDGLRVNGHLTRRLPHNANVTIPGVNADALMMAMKDVAVSSGSACSSATPEPSHVLQAIGLGREEVLSSLRFGLGRFTAEEEIDYAVRRVSEAAVAIRQGRRQMQFAH
jgi:cysteine desulfurase